MSCKTTTTTTTDSGSRLLFGTAVSPLDPRNASPDGRRAGRDRIFFPAAQRPRPVASRPLGASLERFADPGQRALCPRCGATVTRRELGRVNGHRRIKARCSGLDCYWSRLIDVDDRGQCHRVRSRTSPRLFTSIPPRGPVSDETASATVPPCLVHHCLRPATERHLCPGHLTLWRLAGSPDCVETWATRYASQRGLINRPDPEVAVRFAESYVASNDPQDSNDDAQLTDEEYQRMFGRGEEEPFEA